MGEIGVEVIHHHRAKTAEARNVKFAMLAPITMQ